MISCYENIQALGKLRKLSIKQWICCKANAVPGPCPLERALGSQEQLMELTIGMILLIEKTMLLGMKSSNQFKSFRI